MNSYQKPSCKTLVGVEILRICQAQSIIFSETQFFNFSDFNDSNNPGNPLNDCVTQVTPPGFIAFNFNVSGVTPVGDGRIIVTAQGDVDATSPNEFYSVEVEGDAIGITQPSSLGSSCNSQATGEFLLSLANLTGYAQDGTITVNVTPEFNVGCACGDPGETPSRVEVTLEFPRAQ